VEDELCGRLQRQSAWGGKIDILKEKNMIFCAQQIVNYWAT
jgi:hypothetical protein